MTLNDFKENYTTKALLKKDTDTALILKNFFNTELKNFHNKEDDSLCLVWDDFIKSFGCETFGDIIKELSEEIDKYYFFECISRYSLENKLFKLTSLAQDYKKSDNEAIRKFFEMDPKELEEFMRRRILPTYVYNGSVFVQGSIGDIITDVKYMWLKDPISYKDARELTAIIMVYPFLFAFFSTKGKNAMKRLLNE